MKKWQVLIVILIIIGISLGIYFWKMMVSPQYSLKQLEKAIDEQDVHSFDKYVDLDEVVDHMIVQTWEYYTSRVETESRWSEIRDDISGSLLSVVKPNLKEIIKREIRKYITTGKWTGTEEENGNQIASFIIGLIKERIDPGQWEHQTINYTQIEGENALVGLTYYDQNKEANFLVEVKMRDMKGYWQIIQISNITQLINMFQSFNNN